jgi:hypothetical protein
VARTVSNVFSPPVVAVPVLVTAVWVSNVPGTWRFALLYVLVAMLVPLAHLLWSVYTGRVSDFHLENRRERTEPFLVSLACSTVVLLLLVPLGAPPIFIVFVRAVLLQALILFAITMVWQVSVHTAATAAMATTLVLAVGPDMGATLLLIPVVGWARLRLRRHTLAQVATGALIGTATVIWIFHGWLW